MKTFYDEMIKQFDDNGQTDIKDIIINLQKYCQILDQCEISIPTASESSKVEKLVYLLNCDYGIIPTGTISNQEIIISLQQESREFLLTFDWSWEIFLKLFKLISDQLQMQFVELLDNYNPFLLPKQKKEDNSFSIENLLNEEQQHLYSRMKEHLDDIKSHHQIRIREQFINDIFNDNNSFPDNNLLKSTTRFEVTPTVGIGKLKSNKIDERDDLREYYEFITNQCWFVGHYESFQKIFSNENAKPELYLQTKKKNLAVIVHTMVELKLYSVELLKNITYYYQRKGVKKSLTYSKLLAQYSDKSNTNLELALEKFIELKKTINSNK